MTTTNQNGGERFDRRTVLRALGVASVPIVSGCLSGEDDGDESNDDESQETSDEQTEGSDDGEETDSSDDGEESDRSVGTAEITFHDETYTVDDITCDGRTAFPPENELIGFRRPSEGIEFYVERDMGDGSEGGVEVEIGFPSGTVNETIGEVEAYVGHTTIDEIEFELGHGTSGSLHLDPSSLMNDDVEHDPDGGEITWEIAC